MALTIALDELAAELRKKRGDRSLKEVEDAIGVSASTLSRVERGQVPDLRTLKRLAAWLDVKIAAAGEAEEGIRTEDDLQRAVSVYLRASKNLPEEAARNIARSVPLILEWELERWKRRQGGEDEP